VERKPPDSVAEVRNTDTSEKVHTRLINRGLRPPPTTKGKTMEKVEMTVVAADEAPNQTLGNRLKFKLEFMFMMLHAGRNEEAAKVYDQLIEEFDKLA